MSETAAVSTHRYERWTGKLSSGQWTWLAIVAHGWRLGYKRQEVKFFLMGAAGFVVGPCIVFYLISLLEELSAIGKAAGLLDFVQNFLHIDLSSASQIGQYRELLWRATFLFVNKAEFLLVLLVASAVGPGLIADDLKTRALPIYFARPVRPWNYVLGKGLVLAIFVGAVTLVPNLLALGMGTLLTGGLPSFGRTALLAGHLTLIGLGTMALTSSLLLALSSLGSDKRLVTFGWLAICLIPSAAQKILTESLPAERTMGFLGSVSLTRNLSILTEWLFDMRKALEATPLPPDAWEQALGPAVKPLYPAIVLGSLVVFSVLICYRRVVRFSQAAANV